MNGWVKSVTRSNVWFIKSKTCVCPLKVFMSRVNELETNHIQEASTVFRSH